jgi:hypothetical protein
MMRRAMEYAIAFAVAFGLFSWAFILLAKDI